MVIIYIIILAVLCLSVYWEYKDNRRLENKKHISEIKTAKGRIKEYEFYGAFNYENNVQWRTVYIGAFISTLLLYTTVKLNVDSEKYMYIFLTIFLVYYFITNFRTFHLYRIMASKVKSNSIIL